MKLTESQEYAYNELLKFCDSKTEKEIILTGSPGYGKSFLIEKLSETKRIILTATTNKASAVFDGITIYSLIGIKLKENKKTGKEELDYARASTIYNAIIVIDECSMITEELYKAIDRYTSNCKIIYVGDFYQLPPVNDNFSIFKKGIKTLELKEPCRTDKEDIINLCNQIKRSIVDNTIFKQFRESDNIKFIRTNEELNEILKTFHPIDDKILTYTNDDVVLNNCRIRKIFGMNELINVDDYVVCKSVIEGYIPAKIEEVKRIKSIIRENNDGTVKIKTYDNGIYNVYLNQNSYRERLKKLAEESIKSNDWSKYFFYKKTVLDIRDVYASTIHSSQGSTYKDVFINLRNIYKYSDENLMRLVYVAVSRAKEKVYLFKD